MDNINHIYKNHPKPAYRGVIENADAAGNADSVSLQTKIGFTSRINQTTIIDIKFTCCGQDSAAVFASYLAGLVKGKDILQAAFISYRQLQPYFNAAPGNLKPAALAALRAFSDMLSSYWSSTDQKLYPLDDNRVVVAMSGGIDSSVTAKMLVEEGYQVIGVTLKLLPDSLNYRNKSETCCSPTYITLARRVCLELGIPHLVLDIADEFKETIIDTFFDKYMQGITPNPCVDCNPRIKFGLLLDRSLQLGAGYMATGHYCILEKNRTPAL
ncbi:MAG: iron-sulfur cluster assembly scaffold protein [Actinomycetota bacterium]|nr:iron-sulfur cluster assembly scaffold protein [Actinomycetota bacterium]